jgi:L-2-hydroxyglutarate oxidase LhgO
MIFNPKEYFAEESHLSADLLIVGAGTVGIYLAHSISKKYPLTKILVIEAGGRVASLPDTTQNQK